MILKPILMLTTMLIVTGCATTDSKQAQPVDNAVADTVDANSEQFSYQLGLMHLTTLRTNAEKLNLNLSAYEQGLRAALDSKTLPAPTVADWQAQAGVSLAQLKTANLAAGRAFLAQNKIQKEVVTLASGVQYQVLQTGQGDPPRLKDTIGILYTISGIDGKTKIDTMEKGKSKMYEIKLAKLVSKGWREALQLMPLNSKWRLFIPGELAFGEQGLTEKGIMPNELLIIDTYLVEIK